MFKKILPFEIGKLLALALVIFSLGAIGYGAYWLIWYLIQLLISPLPRDFIFEISEVLPESLQIFRELVNKFFLGTSAELAKSECLHYALTVAVGAACLLLGRWLLRLLETGFKRKIMPFVLSERFTDVLYDPKKLRSIDEPLCAIGLLRYLERYYSANRLEGYYRGCWVAGEEIVCGGVYMNNYTSHRVKARGLWRTIRLNRAFEGNVILESTGTKNRFTHSAIAKTMTQIEFDYPSFTERFLCFSDYVETAEELINREMADKLLRILDKYPDLCVIFEGDCVHFLVRRRSFDRRWEYLIPFCTPHLRKIANDLYGPLMDATDELLR